MAKKKTHQEYIEEVALINPNIEVVEKYINAQTKIYHKCKICGHKWSIRPTHILSGIGCPMCANKSVGDKCRKTHIQYVEELNNVNPNIKLIGDYINTHTPTKHYCVIHDILFNISPYNALCGHGCEQCKSDKISSKLRKSHETYVQELNEQHPDIEVVDEYINADTPILHRCKKCGNEWSIKPNHVLQGHGCSSCNKSLGEKTILKWLENHNIVFIPQHWFRDCRDKTPLPFDFYLPDYNMCIEYDGEQHFRAVDFFGGEEGLKIRQLHDNIKNDYCIKHDIPLLRIPYNKNIEEELNNFFIHLIQ